MTSCPINDPPAVPDTDRRRLLGAALGVSALATLPRFGLVRDARAAAMSDSVPASGSLLFDVFRHRAQIGTHNLRFVRTGDALLVHIDVAMKVGLGFLTLFRYRMQAIERWQAGRFVGLNASGDNNGQAFSTQAVSQGDRVEITATGVTRYLSPPGALPLTHWNMQAMTMPLFNPQTGRMMDERARDLGVTPVPAPAGPTAQARQWSLRGEQTLDDWYDDAKWTALSAIAKDGSTVVYQRR